MITSLIPDHDWKLWKFSRVSVDYWKDINNQREYMDSLAKELNITKMDDWYNVKQKVKNYCDY